VGRRSHELNGRDRLKLQIAKALKGRPFESALSRLDPIRKSHSAILDQPAPGGDRLQPWRGRKVQSRRNAATTMTMRVPFAPQAAPLFGQQSYSTHPPDWIKRAGIPCRPGGGFSQ
jgi:hypothetical protein